LSSSTESSVQPEIRAPASSRLQSRIGVVTYPGSQDDRDALWALAALGAEAVPVWHEESDLSGLDAVVLPGGFSYGDYLRCGAIARFSAATAAVREFAAAGGYVLGICNGFQILCEAGLLPGVLLQNESLRFVCRDAPLRVERNDLAFTSRCAERQRLVIPVKHGDGRYVPPPDLNPAQVVLRYLDNPNGSVDAIAGVCNEAGNVMGLMPHPEHAVDPLLGSDHGALILASLIDAARDRSFAAA
jgi:phosphoribosylformylglycinamidine synthase subunit PurQ / glutaminase